MSKALYLHLGPLEEFEELQLNVRHHQWARLGPGAAVGGDVEVGTDENGQSISRDGDLDGPKSKHVQVSVHEGRERNATVDTIRARN